MHADNPEPSGGQNPSPAEVSLLPIVAAIDRVTRTVHETDGGDLARRAEVLNGLGELRTQVVAWCEQGQRSFMLPL